MITEEMENLDSETQEDIGGDVATEEVEETPSETEPATETDDELEKARQIAEDQKARAEKAERKLKDLKAQLNESKPEPQKAEGQKSEKSDGDTLTKEEAILYARGLSEEEVDKVKSIAKLEGETILVAAESELFNLWKEKETKKREAQETQLGTSRGSAKTQTKKTFSTPGLSSEERKALWKKAMGR